MKRLSKACAIIVFVLSITVMAAACSKDIEKNENESSITKSTEETKGTEDMNNSENNEYVVNKMEISIPNGENTIYGMAYIPHGDGPFPAIILSHGYNGCNTDFASDCLFYAKQGYIAYSFDFCGGSGKSKSTGKSTDMTIFTEKSDLIAIVDYFAKMDKVDSNQLFLMGGSQGGLVTALTVEEKADMIKGMILYYPALCVPDDWRKTYPTKDMIPEEVDFWGLKLGKGFFETIHDFYVFDNIGSFDKDILIIHGDKDNIVPLSYSQKAKEKYKSVELITMTGEGHGFSPNGSQTAREAVLEYLVEHTN